MNNKQFYYYGKAAELLNLDDFTSKRTIAEIEKVLEIVGIKSLNSNNDLRQIEAYLLDEQNKESTGTITKTQTAMLDLSSPFLYTGPEAAVNPDTNQFEDFGLQGIKGTGSKGNYYIVGTSSVYGTVYTGPIDHILTPSGSGSGTWTIMSANFSDVSSSDVYATSIYGVATRNDGNVNLVGSWQDKQLTTENGDYYRKGFYYTGPVTSSPQPSDFTVVWPSDPETNEKATFTYVHSVDGDLAVGGYDFYGSDSLGATAIQAFLYDPATNTTKDINYPGDYKTNTAYGIWHNGDGSYTISGGAGLEDISNWNYGDPLSVATLIDYDRLTGELKNFRAYSYDDVKSLSTLLEKNDIIDTELASNSSLVTHFEGIYFDGQKYTLPATISLADRSLAVAAIAKVDRMSDGGFGDAEWTLFDIPGSIVSTNDSVYGDASIGAAIYVSSAGEIVSDYAGLLL